MATSGAYKNSAYTFNFSFTKASDPTAFFTGTFLTSEVKVVTRDGGTTNAAVNIASAPSHEGNGVYEINLTASEMNHDEIMIVLVPSSADVVPESISIVTEPTPSDVLEVQKTAVTIADFKADVSALATQASVNTIDTEVGQIKAKTDQLTFTVANQVDANALTGGGGDATAANQTSIINHLTDVKGTGFAKDTHSLTDITADVTGINGAAMRGTDGAYTGTPPTEAQIYAEFATGTNPNPFKADVSGLSTFNAATDTVSVGDKTGFALSSAANDAIGAAFLSYTLTKGSPGTIERAFWQSLKTQALTDGEVSGTPGASAFDTNLTATTGAYDHLLLLFTSGALAGEARPIDTYVSTNGRITLQEALTAAPSSSDEFIIVPDHTNPISEIQSGLATSAALAVVDSNVDSILADTSTDGVVISTAQAQAIADEVLKRSVGNVEGASLSEHSLATIVLAILESQRVGSTWSIYRTDGTTVHKSKVLTLESGADPVIGVQ